MKEFQVMYHFTSQSKEKTEKKEWQELNKQLVRALVARRLESKLKLGYVNLEANLNCDRLFLPLNVTFYLNFV